MGRREKILGENVPSLVNLLKKAYCDEMRCCIDDYTIAKIIDRIASGVIEILRSFIVRENGNKGNNFRIVISMFCSNLFI